METSEPGDIRDTGMPTRRNTTPPIGRQQCIPIMPPLSPDPGQSRIRERRNQLKHVVELLRQPIVKTVLSPPPRPSRLRPGRIPVENLAQGR
jgi:hypothetical protein